MGLKGLCLRLSSLCLSYLRLYLRLCPSYMRLRLRLCLRLCLRPPTCSGCQGSAEGPDGSGSVGSGAEELAEHLCQAMGGQIWEDGCE